MREMSQEKTEESIRGREHHCEPGPGWFARSNLRKPHVTRVHRQPEEAERRGEVDTERFHGVLRNGSTLDRRPE